MLSFAVDFIYGVQLGFEFADQETKRHFPEIVWGVAIDLLIIRFSVLYLKKD